MERPSHMSLPQLCMPCRLPLVAAAVSFQVLVFWLFSQGVGMRIVDIVKGPLEVTFRQTEPAKTPPPTEPRLREKIDTIVPIPPEIRTDPNPDERRTVTVTPSKPLPDAQPQPAVLRAPMRNAATNTTPPYPVIARRLGWEGTVTLRLMVTEAGRVARAEVVTSSGHAELDQTAQSWVVERWTYRPATRDGVAVAGQVLARVQFTLDGR